MTLPRALCVSLRLALCALSLLAFSACGEDSPMNPLPPDTVDSGGGILDFEGGRVRVEVPSGAVGSPLTVTVTEVAAAVPDSGLVSSEYAFGPFGTEFDEAVNLRLAVDPGDLVDLANPDDVIGGVRVGDEWQGVPGSYFDAATSEVVIPLYGFAAPDTTDIVDTGPTPSPKRAGSSVGVLWYGSQGRGENFAILRPLYVTTVGGNDVSTCGTMAQPCFTMRYAMAKARFGEKVVLLGPGTFGDAQQTLDLPSNTRLEGQNGAVIEDVVLTVYTEPNLAAVKGVALESTVGQIAISVTGGRPLFQDISSRFSDGIRISGGEVTLRNVSLRDAAAYIDVTGGTQHFFQNCTIRNGAAGIIFQRSSGGTLQGCNIRGNDIGVYLPYFANVTFAGNNIRSNDIGVMMGHDPNPVLDVPTCTATFAGNTIRDNLSAGVRLATTGIVNFQPNTWTNAPPQRWNGPAPWVGAPDIVDILAPLGDTQWWELQGGGPSPRLGAAMAWEEDLQQVVLFGGLGASGAVLDDTWAFEPSTLQWQRLNNVIPPPARTDHAMAGGLVSGRCFLFGGRDNATPFNVFDDFYVLDPVAEEWLPLNPAPNPDGRRPGPRYGANLVRITSSQFLLYGGLNGAGSYAEWWIYDAQANAWTDATDNNALPPFRGYAAAGFGPSGEVWTFGGNDSAGNPLSGLHRFVWGNGNTNEWTSWASTQVPALTFASFERAQTGNGAMKLVLFGGVTGGFNSDVSDETWILTPNFGGSPSWERLWNLTVRPDARARHASASYRTPHGDACLIFGGNSGGTTLLGDTWIYSAGGGR